MGLFGTKKEYDYANPAEIHPAPPPGWCIRAVAGKLHVDTSGVTAYTLRAKSFFGPNLESWFSALLTRTFIQEDRAGEYHPFLLQHYLALLVGLRDILFLGWDVWHDDRPGKPKALSHNPMAGDMMNMFAITYLQGSLAFLQKSVELHNRLAAAAKLAVKPWEQTFMDCKWTHGADGPGVANNRTQGCLEIHATPATLNREIERLSGRGCEADGTAGMARSSSPIPSDPPLSAGELSGLRTLYARMATVRLQQLLIEAADLRPGAEPLLRQELAKRGKGTDK